MKPFTDEDLSLLKKELERTSLWRSIPDEQVKLSALINRLEAAESALGTDCYANSDCSLCKVHYERYITWLNSKWEE